MKQCNFTKFIKIFKYLQYLQFISLFTCLFILKEQEHVAIMKTLHKPQLFHFHEMAMFFKFSCSFTFVHNKWFSMANFLR
mmetsp:Transcript_35281/g.81716  ORF Transcript_35281/g.81716 Transcript_35281/m.81716 type:complete len:80 (+) Transcript_35281:154-393(+)